MANIVSMKSFIKESKSTFRSKMLPMGLGSIILAVVFICVYGYYSRTSYENFFNMLFVFGGMIFIYSLGYDFFQLRKFEAITSKYLDGEDPNKILE